MQDSSTSTCDENILRGAVLAACNDSVFLAAMDAANKLREMIAKEKDPSTIIAYTAAITELVKATHKPLLY